MGHNGTDYSYMKGDKNPGIKKGTISKFKGLTKKENPDIINWGLFGDKNPMKRPEVIKKMVETRKRNGSYLKGDLNVSRRPEVRKKLSEIMKNRKCPWTIEYNKRVKSIEQSGAGNSNWRGGISKEERGIEWTKELKKEIIQIDNYQCQKCDCLNKEMPVHHIDYNKKNNSKDNLITLCRNCHGQTNFEREYWEWQFKIFMNLFKQTNHLVSYNIGGGYTNAV